MSKYSIKDLEQLSGIKAHTLRIWEQRYAIIDPDRTDTNIRTYDDQDLKLVLNISLLKEHGYKISEIAKLPPDVMSREVTKISERQLNQSDQVQALVLAMIDLDEERFNKIINANVLQHGFENTMIRIVYPFLNRIGTLWVTGAVGPAQEHFVTNLVRQKIIVAIDGQMNKQEYTGKKYLLFLPEGEFHELSLLFANYVVRARSHNVVYLGQSLPFSELLFISKRYQPDFVFTVITSSPINHQVQPFVDRLAEVFPDAQILLTGFQVVGQDITTPANTRIINQIEELTRIAST
ncbi:MerR family transcriptional regulator [Spirosoma daeguense]